MNKFLTFATAFALCNTMAQANPKNSEDRHLNGFTKIEQSGSIKINYYQSKTFKVVAHCDEGDIKEIKTRVDGNKLVVYIEGKKESHLGGLIKVNGMTTVKNAYVDVYSPTIEKYNGAGSGSFTAKTDLNIENIVFQLSGSGKIKIGNATCTNMDINLAGSGNVSVGKAKVNGKQAISLSGSGNVNVNATCYEANISLAGSGDIVYNGSNKNTSVSIAGSGSVTGEVFTDSFHGTTTGSGRINMNGKAGNIKTSKTGSGSATFTNNK